MRELYPEISPSKTFSLNVGASHSIYMEESGNPDGIPVVFLHGGPGGGSTEKHRRYFNPEMYRIVIFDQRGAGRSSPMGSVHDNTTQELLSDMETIRQKLGIEKWMLFGGSWGSTLALLYAQQYPEHVLALILRGTFLARNIDLDWFFKEGANRLLPEFWDQFIEILDEEERRDIISAYHKRVHGDDKQKKLLSAKAWSEWSGRVVTYMMVQGELEAVPDELVLQEVSIETHYAKFNYFIEENQILNNADKLPVVPVRIVHGRRDLTCIPEASWALHRALPDSELEIIPDAGHLAADKTMCDALIRATDDMAQRLTH